VNNAPFHVDHVRPPTRFLPLEHRSLIARVLDSLDTLPELDAAGIDRLPLVAWALGKRSHEAASLGYDALSMAIAHLVRALASTFIECHQPKRQLTARWETAPHCVILLALRAQNVRKLTSEILDQVLSTYFLTPNLNASWAAPAIPTAAS
jgi:hypothetical protein